MAADLHDKDAKLVDGTQAIHRAQSTQLFAHAQTLIPGGVNSPVRNFSAVDDDPPFIARGAGAYLYDVDGNQWLDYVCSWGATILGHAHPALVEACQNAAAQGLSFGAPTAAENELVERLSHLMPALEMARLVNSGTEAAMSAIRLARGYTQRDLLVKFEGNYHGHADHLLVGAGSGAQTFGTPDSAGVPKKTAEDTIVATYNDLDHVRAIFERNARAIAAVIVEPIAGNMNYIPSDKEFLVGLRDLCTQHGSVLIFDEVMTGFRVARGGAQALYDITPDLTVLGKVIGGGMPLAAFGGRKDIMQCLAPIGPVYQAGTLSGNPVAVRCGLAALEHISATDFYSHLDAMTQRLCNGLRAGARANGVPFYCAGTGGMFGFAFPSSPIYHDPQRDPQHDIDPASYEITRYAQIKASDQARFRLFHRRLLAQGIYLAPSAYEAGFVSAAHKQDDIDYTINIAHSVMRDIASAG